MIVIPFDQSAGTCSSDGFNQCLCCPFTGTTTRPYIQRVIVGVHRTREEQWDLPIVPMATVWYGPRKEENQPCFADFLQTSKNLLAQDYSCTHLMQVKLQPKHGKAISV